MGVNINAYLVSCSGFQHTITSVLRCLNSFLEIIIDGILYLFNNIHKSKLTALNPS